MANNKTRTKRGVPDSCQGLAELGEKTALPEMSLQDSKYQYKQMTTFEDKELGRGTYGQVCQGLCDELPCAVKCLHRTVFQFMDGSAEENAKKIAAFERECQILLRVHHPCIVQYLDAYVQPETGLAILLMELMDETLNCFLDRTQSPLPIHLQIDLCFNVIQAITYLHSCNIIHRNLTGNNVLISGGSRAKVTDFGMMRIMDSHKQFSSQSKHIPLPDSSPYMAPEVFRHPPSKTTQLDIFSFGVISLQVMTGRFPQPSSINASEIERRKSDIDSLEHPMLLATLSCLKDRDILRPTALQLCRKFKQLRETSMYEESQIKREQALQAIDAMSKEVDKVHKKNDELIAKLEYVRYENEHLIQLISSQTENMSSNVDIAVPYVDPENIEQASLLNDGLEYQMDFSAPHPALWYHGSITRDTACMRLQSIAKPGAYLVRMSESDPGSFVLSFLDKQLRLFNYKISCKNGKYNASGQGRKWFPSLQNLIGYYTRHSTVKQNQHLDIPVAPPKVVPLPNS